MKRLMQSRIFQVFFISLLVFQEAQSKSYDNVNSRAADASAGINPGIRINIWPNPATDIIYLSAPDFPRGCRFDIADMQGRIIKSNISQGTTIRMDVSGLAAGCYLIRATDLNSSRKITKQFFRN